MMNKRRAWLGVFTIVLGFWSLAGIGCSEEKTTDPNRGLITALNSPVADVPVPAGFTMNKKSRSELIPGSGLRIVDHEYTGSDSYIVVAKYYRDNLPNQYGWKFLSQSQQGEKIVQRYSKANEECTITTWPNTFSSSIGIRIRPLGQ